jgi:23S rRNA (adenine1618-N6)-methyltransferase
MVVLKDKGLHKRNIHNEAYDFNALINSSPELDKFVNKNNFGNLSINYSNPDAVIALNRALLIHFYKLQVWDIPKGHLCPPIPGRVDYIHHIADLLADSHNKIIPTGKNVRGLDIGVGANCIYPIIGNSVYGWKFVGTDIESASINSAKNIIKLNKSISKNIKIRFQKDSINIFDHTISNEEFFDFTMCNPPFHSSMEEAIEGSQKKVRNLNLNSNKKRSSKSKSMTKELLNFGGKNAELYCQGGEIAFIKRMILQSYDVKDNCLWFTTLVSKKENLETIYSRLNESNVSEVKTIEMQHGQKLSRIVAWTYKTQKERNDWALRRWK